MWRYYVLELDAQLGSHNAHSNTWRGSKCRNSGQAIPSVITSSADAVATSARECDGGRKHDGEQRTMRRHVQQLIIYKPPPWVPAVVPILDLGQLEYRPIRSPTLQRVFRFWIDEPVVPGTGAKTVERVLLDLGGTKTGSPPPDEIPPVKDMSPAVLEALPSMHKLLLKRNLQPEVLGCCNMSEWDLLWSSHYCALSAVSQGLSPCQIVNAVPGLWMLSNLPKLMTLLTRCYGQHQTFEMLPRSFSLPQQLDQWLSWLSRHLSSDQTPSSSSTEVSWLLKGRNTQPVPSSNVEKIVQQLKRSSQACPAMVAQHYISNPFLVDGHKCHLQLWCLVTGTNPLRAYLHRNGLVCMASEPYHSSQGISGDGELTGGHDTRGEVPGVVWNLYQLKQLMGAAAFSKTWSRMKEICAFLVSCVLSDITRKQGELRANPSSVFHLLGLQFVLDSTGQPWLTRVQASPSLDVRHPNPGLMCLINDQKAKVVKDTLNLVVRRLYRTSSGIAEESPQLDSGLALAEKELQHLGGFEPLMPLFPLGASSGKIPWSKADITLRSMMESSSGESIA